MRGMRFIKRNKVDKTYVQHNDDEDNKDLIIRKVSSDYNEDDSNGMREIDHANTNTTVNGPKYSWSTPFDPYFTATVEMLSEPEPMLFLEEETVDGTTTSFFWSRPFDLTTATDPIIELLSDTSSIVFTEEDSVDEDPLVNGNYPPGHEKAQRRKCNSSRQVRKLFLSSLKKRLKKRIKQSCKTAWIDGSEEKHIELGGEGSFEETEIHKSSSCKKSMKKKKQSMFLNWADSLRCRKLSKIQECSDESHKRSHGTKEDRKIKVFVNTISDTMDAIKLDKSVAQFSVPDEKTNQDHTRLMC